MGDEHPAYTPQGVWHSLHFYIYSGCNFNFFFNLIHSRNISISERGLLSWDAVLIYAVCFVSACVAADLGNGSSLKDDSIRQPY